VWLLWFEIFVTKITEKYKNYVIARVISFFTYTKTFAKNHIIFLEAVTFVSDLHSYNSASIISITLLSK